MWGIERDGEIGSVWRGSGHDGLWFAFGMATFEGIISLLIYAYGPSETGNLSMARYYSKFLALRGLHSGCFTPTMLIDVVPTGLKADLEGVR